MNRLYSVNYLICFIVLIVSLAAQSGNVKSLNGNTDVGENTTLLARHKRYVAFPEGSSVSAALCLTVGVIGNPNVNWLSWAVNWGVAYNLPSYAWAKEHASGFANRTTTLIKRRSRRDLYNQIQLIFEKMGFDGQSCIARALCESALMSTKKNSYPSKGNMFEEIVKTIFNLPTDDGLDNRSHLQAAKCVERYPKCGFSLIETLFGDSWTLMQTKEMLNIKGLAFM